MIGFEGAGRRTTTRLLSGEFPRYQALLPSAVNAAAQLSTGLLAESVKRVALVAERNTAVRLAFSAGQLMLEAGTGDEAQAEEIIEAEFEGEDLSIAFNPQYLLDWLVGDRLGHGADLVHRAGKASPVHRASPGRTARRSSATC